MTVINHIHNKVGKVPGERPIPAKPQALGTNSDFRAVFQEAINKGKEVKFSKHAEFRLQTRSIRLTDNQKMKLNEALDKAEKKGIRDTLVLLDELALVVNVKNRTVITAANSAELKESVFTNIDGAVIV